MKCESTSRVHWTTGSFRYDDSSPTGIQIRFHESGTSKHLKREGAIRNVAKKAATSCDLFLCFRALYVIAQVLAGL